MRCQRGFTLIELVLVIVVLGILGAIAAPRFINLQQDAYRAHLRSLERAVVTTANLGHAKALLNGYDMRTGVAVADADKNYRLSENETIQSSSDIEFYDGYPAASDNGIIRMLNRNASDFSADEKGTSLYLYRHINNDASGLRITLRSRPFKDVSNNKIRCELTYQQPKALGDAPQVTIFTEGC